MTTETAIEQGPFRPSFESLGEFLCPEWFRDAKFGIWSHWGPQSVPMYGDWYARQMYIEGHDQYRYHIRKYGHPSKFGYKDVAALWKAEKFDPESLMSLYVNAGAKYFVAQAAHHDNFHNWDSTHHRWNAVKAGPKKDIVAMWQGAARRAGLPFGLSEHLGASFSWAKTNKGADKSGRYAGVPYDGNDRANEDLYLPNRDAPGIEKEWYTKDPRWPDKWFAYIKDLIDRYQPELLYTDGGLPFGEAGLRIIAHLYNTSARLHEGANQAVYTQKDRNPEIHKVGILDIERSQLPGIPPHVWQTDSSVGDWFYNIRDIYKTPQQVTEMLVDIASKNGNLLLNIPQRPDGTHDEECLFLLEKLAEWMKINGEGIHGTRPWKRAGEGPSSVVIEGFREDAVKWTAEDFRFTAKNGKVYAFLMKWPEGGCAAICALAGAKVKDVALLGSGPVKFEETSRGLLAYLPERKPCAWTQCLALSLADDP